MKKIIIPSVIVVWVLIAQGYYILKLKHDLDIRKKINEETILEVFNKSFDYVKHEESPEGEPLEEPDCLNNNSDIVERINMLEMHLDYNPSKKWIKEVLNQAKNKLSQ
jgi:hypothetical protein